MGYYINPKDCSKEVWLALNGKQQANPPKWSRDSWPVCLIDNGAFTAAAIGYCQEEVDVFAIPDGRPKKWFLVPREKLVEFCLLATPGIEQPEHERGNKAVGDSA